MDKTQENFRYKLKLSHISIYSKSGPCKTARFISDSNGTSGRKKCGGCAGTFLANHQKKSQHRQKIHITDNIYMLKREEGLIVLFFLLYFLLHSMFALNKYLFLFST